MFVRDIKRLVVKDAAIGATITKIFDGGYEASLFVLEIRNRKIPFTALYKPSQTKKNADPEIVWEIQNIGIGLQSSNPSRSISGYTFYSENEKEEILDIIISGLRVHGLLAGNFDEGDHKVSYDRNAIFYK